LESIDSPDSEKPQQEVAPEAHKKIQRFVRPQIIRTSSREEFNKVTQELEKQRSLNYIKKLRADVERKII